MTSAIPLIGGIPAGPELLIILLVLVLLFGANKIPKLARSTGQAMGEFKKGREEIEDELEQMQDGDESVTSTSPTESSATTDAATDDDELETETEPPAETERPPTEIDLPPIETEQPPREIEPIPFPIPPLEEDDGPIGVSFRGVRTVEAELRPTELDLE